MINLARLKEQALPLLVVSLSQIALNFSFPAFTELGTFSLGALSLIFIFLYMIIFCNARHFKPLFELTAFDEAPPILKDIMRVTWVLIMHAAFLYVWYVDLYHMSSLMYKMMFVHYWLVIWLLYRAAYRE